MVQGRGRAIVPSHPLTQKYTLDERAVTNLKCNGTKKTEPIENTKNYRCGAILRDFVSLPAAFKTNVFLREWGRLLLLPIRPSRRFGANKFPTRTECRKYIINIRERTTGWSVIKLMIHIQSSDISVYPLDGPRDSLLTRWRG